ncbi:LLM class oxidoreductase [Streptomyces sp. KPB2]|uniref:LLM class oxidoreductase n=1 Tax=Streptomyces sp. KPB2 TaxID=2305221 RepID=UPI000F6C0225|nr:LLM class oxidoreductase [Streptomyces sp. KPB2]AZM75429.1 LLM class oxidoreductase [Streptomyces sp. KPB2]
MSCFDPRFASRPGYARVFRPGGLTLGLFFPMESYDGPVPRMDVNEQSARALQAERAGFAALWVRDIPLLDPSFGDAGQLYDPWVWLSHIAARTTRIALATGSTVLPLRNPIDTAKSAASVDLLSGGRLVLGAATGDRGVEFPAYGLDRDDSPELFRTAVTTLRRLWSEDFPAVDSRYGTLRDAGVLPKPDGGRIPLLVTGHSRQSMPWIAEHADGWLMYPRPLIQQRRTTAMWQKAVAEAGGAAKPFSQSLYLDLVERADARPSAIHLGYRTGRRYLRTHLEGLREAGVHHVVLNLKYGRRPADEVVQELAEYILPHFPAHERAAMASAA